ncbi:MAG TPA: complex I subunit 1 family protein [Acidimicrobiia bacterium]|jgi:NADH-quinone oxidoreductase subunit H|nr:complex I subunit 1 family protein [Acidimicrobiia bacterium]
MNPLLALDPLFNNGVSWSVFFVVLIKVAVAFAVLLVAVMLYIWGMRKVIADMQNRIGPNRAGPYGVLQTLADGIKLFFKEQSIPDSADRPVFRLAPYLSIMPAFLMFCIIPIGATVSILGHKTYLQVADLPIGALWILAMSGLGVYGMMLAGWSSGSKYPLLGSVRASAQLLSYEAAFGLAIVAVLIQANTLSTHDIVFNEQYGTSWHTIVSDAYWPRTVVAFIIFLIAACAEVNHPPFDLVEAEQELVGGFNTEYTGIRFAIFFLAEFMNVITMSAIAVTLFLGGPSGPLIGTSQNFLNTWLVPIFWFTIKVLALLFVTVWVRASLPRIRYDRLMAFGWKVLIELAILWVLVTAALQVAQVEDWNLLLTAVIVVVIAVGAYAMLWLAIPKRGELVEEIR